MGIALYTLGFGGMAVYNGAFLSVAVFPWPIYKFPGVFIYAPTGVDIFWFGITNFFEGVSGPDGRCRRGGLGVRVAARRMQGGAYRERGVSGLIGSAAIFSLL
jgi:hypothetical protein